VRPFGQVFTPRPVADWMVRWVCAHQPRRVLDPALGQGVFVDAIEALVNERPDGVRPRIDAFEIDSKLLDEFMSRPREFQPRCRREDFLTAGVSDTYDAIVANPPYVRHHDMDRDDGAFRRFDRLAGRRLSRMTNLYGLFLIKIWSQLAPNGRAAVITPAEWLNADFGRAIKAFLLEQNAIDAIVQFDPVGLVFDDALTTAAITLLRRDRPDDAKLTLASVDDLSALQGSVIASGRRLDRRELDPRRKWSPLFDPSRSIEPITGPTLGDVARCVRGIATGANQYFALRESDRRRWGLDRLDLTPCITKAVHVQGEVFTEADMRRLVQTDQRVYLLNPRPRLSAAVERYLDEGRRLGIPDRYLPSHRPVWYRPERREPAPIWVSVFARGKFKFVLNRAAALNLTAFHAIYPHEPTPRRVRAIFDYLTGPEAQPALRDHHRIYADGLLKLEPRDVLAMPIPAALHPERVSGSARRG